ncbi:MAG: hypothetical protein ACJAQT_004872 [Akkermansiaceae bacterium]|jgi:hypothetical protein
MIIYPPKHEGRIVLGPGNMRDHVAKMRFTAPEQGTYRIKINTELIAQDPSGVGVRILAPGHEESAELSKTNRSSKHDFKVGLDKGAQVTIGVDRGKDGTNIADHTLVTASAESVDP